MFTCLDGTCSRCQMCTVWWASSSFRSLQLHGNSFILEFFGLGKPKIGPKLTQTWKFWFGFGLTNIRIGFSVSIILKIWNFGLVWKLKIKKSISSLFFRSKYGTRKRKSACIPFPVTPIVFTRCNLTEFTWFPVVWTRPFVFGTLRRVIFLVNFILKIFNLRKNLQNSNI